MTPPDSRTHLSRLQRRMLDPIQRDQDIVTNVFGGGTDPVFSVKTGEKVEYLSYADDSTGGSGSSAKNPTYIDFAIENAMENGVVVAVDKTGPIDTSDTKSGEARLQNGQILMGGGETITVLDGTGRAFPFKADGRRGTLVNSSGNGDAIVYAAQNNLIHGLDFGGGPRDSLGDRARDVLPISAEEKPREALVEVGRARVHVPGNANVNASGNDIRSHPSRQRTELSEVRRWGRSGVPVRGCGRGWRRTGWCFYGTGRSSAPETPAVARF